MSGATLISHGCRLNIAESDRIAAMLGAEDDLVVVNSCAVTAEAVKTARQAVAWMLRDGQDAREPQGRVAAKLGFDEVRGDRPTIDGDERLVGPQALFEERAGDQFLAGAGLAEDKYS